MKRDPPKIETAADWKKAVNFIPKKNQIIIYDGEKIDGIYIKPPRIKIGNGIQTVSDLPFESTPAVEYLEDGKILVINEI